MHLGPCFPHKVVVKLTRAISLGKLKALYKCYERFVCFIQSIVVPSYFTTYVLAPIYLIYLFCQTPRNSSDSWLFTAEKIAGENLKLAINIAMGRITDGIR